MQNITKDTFKTEVLDYQGKVLVDFWAPWCGPCQMLGPVMEELSTELEGKAKVVKINVDEEQQLSTQYEISGIPAVLLFVNGEVKENIVGFRQKQDYIDAVNKY